MTGHKMDRSRHNQDVNESNRAPASSTRLRPTRGRTRPERSSVAEVSLGRDCLARRSSVPDERGAVLILAMVFVLIVSISILALLSLGGNSLLNTANLQSQRSIEYSADGAADAAVQAVRYSFDAYTTSGDCLPSGITAMTISGVSTTVDCSGSTSAYSAQTRVVNFYACQHATCTSGNATVEAQVTFDDYSATGAYACSTSSTTTCGTGVTIDNWTVETATN